MQIQKFEIPTVFVLFGITGDLAKKKIIKALYSLFLKNLLPKKFQVVGFSRREFTDAQIRDFVKQIMDENKLKQPERYHEFLEKFFYVQGQFNDKEGYDRLAKHLGKIDDGWSICSNKLFY